MTEQDIDKFIEQYIYIDKRCEEYIEARRPDCVYTGFDVDDKWIRANFSTYFNGENLRDYDYMSDEDLDESTNLFDKYKQEREDYEWEKMLREEERENRERRKAQYEVEELKRRYNL